MGLLCIIYLTLHLRNYLLFLILEVIEMALGSSPVNLLIGSISHYTESKVHDWSFQFRRKRNDRFFWHELCFIVQSYSLLYEFTVFFGANSR